MSQSEQHINIVPTLEELRNMRIMVVDDIPTNIILIKAILEHGGFTNIVSASNGKKALEYLESHPRSSKEAIDVLLLDIIMPAMDGFTLCRHLRNNPECTDIPIIMVTSEDKWREETARASFDAGAIDIMFKPVRSSELLPRIISALSLKRERDIRTQNAKANIEKLEDLLFQETQYLYAADHHPETGLFTRKRLVASLQQHFQDKQRSEHSCLINIHIKNALSIKANHGQDQYLAFLNTLTTTISADCRATDKLYYLNDDHLLLFSRSHQRDHIGHLIASLSSIEDIHDKRNNADTNIELAIGCVFDHAFTIDDPRDLITLSELAAQKAIAENKVVYKLEQNDLENTVFLEQEKPAISNQFQAYVVKATHKHAHDMLYIKPANTISFNSVRQIKQAIELSQSYSLRDYKIALTLDTSILMDEIAIGDLTSCIGSLYLEPNNFILIPGKSSAISQSNALRHAINTLVEQGFVFGLQGIGVNELSLQHAESIQASYLFLEATAHATLTQSAQKLEYCVALIQRAHKNGCEIIAAANDDVSFINQLPVDYIIGNEISLADNKLSETDKS